MTTARNASPMLLLTKPGTGVKGIPHKLRCVVDLRERNKNTHKVTSPLPDMDAILRRLSRKPYRSLIDGKDAYEHIRIEPDHVDRTAMTTPDGNMVSLVLQQGDCNAVATYQTLMNHIFGSFISVFMDVYLDDIVIYSDTLHDHIQHVKTVIDILAREKLYLSAGKLQFLCKQMKVLGRIVDDHGVRMDPDKVDSVLNWKVPTNKELLRGFLGSVGYLADDIATVRIPMGILTSLTGSESSFKWDYTHQRAFDDVKRLVHAHREHRRVPLDYTSTAPPIWLVTDGSIAGIAGVVTQGNDFRSGHVAAFYSAKLSSAQSNYPVHEIEMLAGVESMLRHREILLGCRFTWVTDHKGLTHLLNQRNLSGRQARWLEKISEFDFDVQYLPGTENVLADALSRIYSFDLPGTVRAPTEYTEHDGDTSLATCLASTAISMPVYVGVEASAMRLRSRSIADTTVLPSSLLASRTSSSTNDDLPGLTTVVTQKSPSTLRMQQQVSEAESIPREDLAPSLGAHGSKEGTEWRARVGPLSTSLPSTGIPSAEPVHLSTLTDGNPLGRATSPVMSLASSARGPRSDTTELPVVPLTKASLASAVPTTRRQRSPVPPAESGRPETSQEFARRIKRVVLHGPRGQQQEGASADVSNVPHKYHSPEHSDPEIDTSVQSTVEGSQLIQHLAESGENINLPTMLRGRYNEDKFFTIILKAPKDFKNFRYEKSEGLMYLKEKDNEYLCIPNVIVNGRSVREILIEHAHSLLAHLGSYKTLNFLRDHVWWKTMSNDVKAYCESCMTCRRSKPSNKKPYGLLNQLKVPSRPWESIGVDFVGPLPESKSRDATFDSITVIIDLLTGMVHLVPSRTNYTAKNVAELIFAEVYKHHGLPRSIVSDRDVLFTSLFWTHLHKLMGVKLRMSSAYHPESDGSTERANRTVTQMLRQCVKPNQKDWVVKLPAIEFAINLAKSDSTGYAPFFLNTGRMPRSMIWDNAGKEEYPAVRAYALRVKSAIMSAHDSIIAARTKQTRDANRRRRPAPFEEQDLVYISTKNISLPKGLARKLAPKYIGPYRVLKDFGNNSYRIDLPANLKRRGVHNVFHASLLRIHIPNDDRLFPGRLDSQVAELEDKDGEWAIDSLVSHQGSKENSIFEAIWKSGDCTWVPYETVSHLPAMKAYFEALGIDGVAQLPLGQGKPPADDPQVYLGNIGLRARSRPIKRARHKSTKRRVSGSRTHLSDCFICRSHPSIPCPSSRTPPADSIPLPTLHRFISAAIQMSGSDPVRINATTIRLPGDGGLNLRDPITTSMFHVPVELGHDYLAFDNKLRRGEFDAGVDLAPCGYLQFSLVFNADADCKFKFTTFDPLTGQLYQQGQRIATDTLVPKLTPKDGKGGNVQYVKGQAEVINYVLMEKARSDMLRTRNIISHIEKRKGKNSHPPLNNHPKKNPPKGRASAFSLFAGAMAPSIPSSSSNSTHPPATMASAAVLNTLPPSIGTGPADLVQASLMDFYRMEEVARLSAAADVEMLDGNHSTTTASTSGAAGSEVPADSRSVKAKGKLPDFKKNNRASEASHAATVTPVNDNTPPAVAAIPVVINPNDGLVDLAED